MNVCRVVYVQREKSKVNGTTSHLLNYTDLHLHLLIALGNISTMLRNSIKKRFLYISGFFLTSKRLREQDREKGEAVGTSDCVVLYPCTYIAYARGEYVCAQ